ncbi:MAG: hypothetical protein NC388_09325 [Clostridium sp.]|nr:hypothetical protein [Clostridium sp.]
MNLTQYDVEFVILFLVLTLLFITSLRIITQGNRGGKSLFCIDLNTTQALKGIACVLILMGHWCTMRIQPDFSFISRNVWLFAANIALTWFMFFSGYGMSLKRVDKGKHKKKWKKSVAKIYLPCLLVSSIAFLLYVILPENFSQEECNALHLNFNIFLLHHITPHNISGIFWSFLFGNGSWYVMCILIFYTLFYLSSYIAGKGQWNFTWVLAVLFSIYFVCAYLYFGPLQAHYYRYCWTFMFGHAVATRTKASWVAATMFLITLGTENWVLHMSYIMAVIGLCIISVVNTKYSIDGKLILWLGSVSYLFYLSHEAISYVLLTYLNIDSVIVWFLFSLSVASALYVLKRRIRI